MTSAIILAGGLGTRLRSAVPDLPKPMAPINGRPFLEYQMRYWIAQGISHFVISIGYRYQAIIDYFDGQFEGANLDYVIEDAPLGTGGALLMASKKVCQREAFLLLNGDTYFSIDLQRFIEFTQKNNADWSFALFRTTEKGRYLGVNVSDDGRIGVLQSDLTFEERLANGGVYLVNPKALAAIPLVCGNRYSLEDDIFPAAINLEQRLFGKEFPDMFIDIGVPEDYFRASTLLVS